MLTLLGTKEENHTKNLTEYYYPQPHHHHHYYSPISFINDSNNSHQPSIYETNQYYTHPNEEHSNHSPSTSLYAPTHYQQQQQYSSEGHTNEIFYPQIPPVYDYNVSSIPNLPPNYSVEQTHCSPDYLTSCVS